VCSPSAGHGTGKWYLTFENTDDQLAPFAAMVPRAMMGAVPGR
jgi:hypothetical protein